MIDYRDNNHYIVYIHIVPKELSGYEWDKYYVGVTGTTVNARWHNGLGYKRNNRPGCYFYKAIEKYGWNNIKHEIIAENLTQNEAKEMEIKLINVLNSFDAKHGYNRTKGGDGLIGHKHSDETKKKLSSTHKGKRLGCERPNSIPIVQFDLSGNYLEVYESINLATKNDKYPEIKDSSAIGRVIKNNNSSHISYNYIWMKLSDVIKTENGYKLKDEDFKKYVRKIEYIYKFDLNGNYLNKYENAINAAKSENIKYTCMIYESCRNKRASNGFIWLFEKDIFIDNEGKVKIPNFRISDYMHINKKVFVFNKDKLFLNKYNSIIEAANNTGMNKDSIRNILNNKTKPRKFIFKYEDDVIESTENVGSFLIKERM